MKAPTAVCQECGEVFEIRPDSKGRYCARPRFCYKDHHATCAICGKDFIIPRDKLSSKTARLCSPECVNKAKGVLAQKSMKASPKYIKICEACGKKFTTSSSQQRFCNDPHYLKCVVCGKEFQANHTQLISKKQTCSDECRYIQTFQTYHDNFDIDKNPEAHAALIKKIETTNLERYGYRNSLDKEGREKSGAAEAFRNKYGADYPGFVEEIQNKRKQTNLDRYGTECPLTDPEVAKKSQETLLAKYGVDNYAKSTAFLKQVIAEPAKADSCTEFKQDPQKFIEEHFDHKPTLAELSEECGIRDSSIGYILDQIGHPDIVAYTYSRMEDEVYEFLTKILGQETEISRNTFKIITPYELDIYLPEYKLGIECDPTITHNSTIPGWSKNDEPKSSTYHKMKTDLCEEKDIFLYHIFGYDWSYHKDVIKSMLRSILGKSLDTVYARNTVVGEVSDFDATKFLNENHRQGAAHSKIRLGLYHEGELVSLMTFSKMRPTIGTGSTNLDHCFELVRFCNKLNTSVVGGASKLFKSFVNKYDPEEIRSFSDRAHTRGTLYSILGFKYDHTADPGYMWVDLKTDRGYARNNAQKSNIKKFLNDDTIDLNKTEVQIMSEHNFVQVFDSGVKLWIWRANDNEKATNT